MKYSKKERVTALNTVETLKQVPLDLFQDLNTKNDRNKSHSGKPGWGFYL